MLTRSEGRRSGEGRPQDEVALVVLGCCMGGGLLVIAGFAITAPSIPAILASMATGTLVAAAAMLVGCLLGFLFGIPRTLQGEGGTEETADGGKGGVRYEANTNLEQISDWLTKILVGVGLTQLSSAGEKLSALADFIAPGLAVSSAPRVLSIAIVTFFSVSGFLFTRS